MESSAGSSIKFVLLSFLLSVACGCDFDQGLKQQLERERVQCNEEIAQARIEIDEERQRAEAMGLEYARLHEEILALTDQLAGLSQAEGEISKILVASGELQQPPAMAINVENLFDKIAVQLTQARLREQSLKGTQIENARLRQVVSRLTDSLRAHEQTVSDLQAQAAVLERSIEDLQSENAAIEQEARDLGQQLALTKAERRKCEQLVREQENSDNSGYVLVAEEADLRRLRQRGLIEDKGRIYIPRRLPEVHPGSVSQMHTVSINSDRICLKGARRRPEVVSIHTYLDEDFSFSRGEDGFCIDLENPLAFWKVSRFLIIRSQ